MSHLKVVIISFMFVFLCRWGTDCRDLLQNGDRWWTLVKAVMNLRVK